MTVIQFRKEKERYRGVTTEVSGLGKNMLETERERKAWMDLLTVLRG